MPHMVLLEAWAPHLKNINFAGWCLQDGKYRLFRISRQFRVQRNVKWYSFGLT